MTLESNLRDNGDYITVNDTQHPASSACRAKSRTFSELRLRLLGEKRHAAVVVISPNKNAWNTRKMVGKWLENGWINHA